MNSTKRRHIASVVLLAVFLPMLLLSSLHVHPEAHLEDGDCKECVHHVPHAGHFTSGTSCSFDCVLCQFLSLPFLMAPLANTVVAWAAISWGVVPVFKFATAGTVPVILSGVLGTGSLMGGVLHLVVFVLDLFIYAPFVIVSNRIDEAKEGKGGEL